MSARPAPKNIYIIGAQCTGKTTLVKELQAYFAQSVNCHAYSSPSIITEVARKVLKEYEFNRNDITNSVERCFALQEHILQAQYEAELSMSQEQPNKWYISDRSGVDPVAYASV
jgi:uridine kinase